MKIGHKILTIFISLITIISLLQLSAVGFAEEYFPGGWGGP